MRKIHYIKCGLILPFVLVCSLLGARELPSGLIQNSIEPESLFSSSVSSKFYEIAYDLANSEDATYIETEQAITFLRASLNLDNNSPEVRSLLLKCICRYPKQDSSHRSMSKLDNFDLVYNLLQEYVDKNANLDLAENAVKYLLEQTDSPVQRETLLMQMLDKFANKNPVFGSELATMLGMLKTQGNSPEIAEQLFQQAYQNNKYNKLAFEKLAELAPEKIEPSAYLERLRLAIRENPIDIQTVLAFAQRAEQIQLYDIAADAYEYCSDLFAYLYPSEPLPANIYIPWAISCYNSPQQYFKCLEIATTIRKTGKFDIMLESLAGRAASKLGEDQIAAQIIRDAEKKAVSLLNKSSRTSAATKTDNNSENITETQLAWFYCFVIPIPESAIEWANRAFSADQNSPSAASLLAYSLTQKKEFNSAMTLIDHFEHNQISELALAQIQIEQGQTAQAIDTLKRAISRDPGSFAAENAKATLAQHSEKYILPVNSASIRLNLERTFRNKIVPSFTVPEQMFSASFNIRNEELSFGGDLDSVISIINNSSEPLIISDDSLFRGNIRIDAIVSGDMNKRIPNLVSKRIRTAAVIEPGRSKIVNLKLITGELRNMLMTYPQASLNITFILYLDPTKTSNDSVTNNLTHIAPVSANVKRPGIVLTGEYLRNRVDSISTGLIGQKIQSAQLFIGLLKEQNAMSDRKAPYHIGFTDGMKTMLESALIYDSGLLRNPENDGWIVKVYTMAELRFLPLDYELIEAVSDNLYNANWPVRLMAFHLLADTQGKRFTKVLESISKTDSSQLVRDLAKIEILKSRSSTGQL